MRLRLTTKHILADATVGVENVVKMAYSELSSKKTQLSAQAKKGPGLFVGMVQTCCSSHQWVLLSAIGLLSGKKEAYIIIIIILFGIGNSPIYLSLSHLGDARPFGHGEEYCPVTAFYSKTKIVLFALTQKPHLPYCHTALLKRI